MEHLSGSAIQVVLSLREGKGFHRILNPTTIVATLNGQSLESGCIEPDPQPSYNTDLVWKSDKNVLRKMRSGQEPVKIECFEIKETGMRDKIGHMLLSLRTARILLPRDQVVDVPATWHTFFNLRSDLKAHKPEILLSLTIEEHDAYERRILSRESMETQNGMREDNTQISSSKLASPYLVEEECLIQLGPITTCRSLFLLEIVAGTAQNLHLFREQAREAAGDYSLWYRVLENDVQLKAFGSLERRLAVDEKAVIRIRSSLEILRNYLQERPNLLLIMQQSDTVLGHSEVDLRSLLPSKLTELSSINESNNDNVINRRCVLNKRTTPRNIGDSQDNEAFLDLQLRLIYIGPKQTDETRATDIFQIPSRPPERFEPPNVNEATSEIDAHRNPCGDFNKCIGGDYRNLGCRNLQNDYENPRIPDDRLPLPRSVVTATNSYNNHENSVEAYHCYCLNVSLTGIQSSSPIQNIEFRFHHPKAEIMSTLYPKVPLVANEKLRLQEIGCKLHFISAAKEIRHLLLSFPPRISVRDLADETKMPSGQTILEVDRLFARDEREIQYEAPLYDNDKNVVGAIDVSMYLQDHGPYYKTHQTAPGENLGPPIMDDSLAYKIVEELEIWKERQQEIFLVELKRKEERHLDRLSEEWQKRRENLEAKLACSVEQCKMLANSLNMATEDLRTRRLKSLEKEARLIKANEDLQWRYEKKLQELQDAFQRMQEELLAKVNILHEQKSILEAELEPLRLENEKLDRLASKQAEELQICRKSTLTQDQTASLIQDVKALEQKLESTQKSKSFFKEQWGKAVREIHRMKMEHQQAIEVQIKTSKDELKNLDLEEILCADSSSLTNDQITLGEIQKEIDVIKPRPTFGRANEPSHRSFFGPGDTVYAPNSPTKSPRSTGKSGERDDRLSKLIEERDSLLKTGSYTIDDAIINNLNAEIRSLLILN
ncbi:centrosomal protein of 120 kDa-like [Venturia canescens]|uniref:centrosomal protein of 120 kDa-like n=1 Tax=Venturia canescens TaxID=32260 RepID=UPI001C9D238E|nr:centrosomal protein of 120 kDa-like [Venturia canescens]XP_043280436.1 centrosomal protein of 120 kDa-like [Venturia canescens]